MKKDRAKETAPAPKKAEPFNNPFAKLAATVGAQSAATSASAAPTTAPGPSSEGTPNASGATGQSASSASPTPAAKPATKLRPGPPPPARAVIRYERKGRGGKEVTVVDKLGLQPKVLAEWLKSLKQSLGVGGQIEGDTLVLQGDQRERLRALLTAKGIGQISVG